MWDPLYILGFLEYRSNLCGSENNFRQNPIILKFIIMVNSSNLLLLVELFICLVKVPYAASWILWDKES